MNPCPAASVVSRCIWYSLTPPPCLPSPPNKSEISAWCSESANLIDSIVENLVNPFCDTSKKAAATSRSRIFLIHDFLNAFDYVYHDYR